MNQEDLNKITQLTESIRKEENNLSTIRGLLSGKQMSMSIHGLADSKYKREYRHFIEDQGLIHSLLEQEEKASAADLSALITKLEQYVLVIP